MGTAQTPLTTSGGSQCWQAVRRKNLVWVGLFELTWISHCPCSANLLHNFQIHAAGEISHLCINFASKCAAQKMSAHPVWTQPKRCIQKHLKEWCWSLYTEFVTPNSYQYILFLESVWLLWNWPIDATFLHPKSPLICNVFFFISQEEQHCHCCRWEYN